MDAKKIREAATELRATVNGCGGNPRLVSDPEFKLAVADWLSMVAGNVENYGPNADSPWVRPHVQMATAVAVAYLG